MSPDLLTVAAAVISAAGGATIAYITSRSQRQQAKESLIVTKEQGATTLFDALTKALQAENERKDAVIERRDGLIRDLRREINDLRDELEGLKRRAGERKGDK